LPLAYRLLASKRRCDLILFSAISEEVPGANKAHSPVASVTEDFQARSFSPVRHIAENYLVARPNERGKIVVSRTLLVQPVGIGDGISDFEPDATAWPLAQSSQTIQPQPEAFEASPGSVRSGGQFYTAEAASLRWFGLLASDAPAELAFSPISSSAFAQDFVNRYEQNNFSDSVDNARSTQTTQEEAKRETPRTGCYVSQDDIHLDDLEIILFHHFVKYLSCWIDVTDPDHSFAVVVPQMALRNRGLMTAILALSSRRLSLDPAGTVLTEQLDRTFAVQYYHETLQYLQQEMKNALYLTSDELLATVLTISTYEMIDGSDKGWERHLIGVFWIQRSQLIHGESFGLKRCIWWAWLRQDIWAAFKERRKILSFYKLARPCSSLGFWELINRSIFLLGQCVNFASTAEAEAGILNVQARIERADSLQANLEEWRMYFEPYNRRLPSKESNNSVFKPIWINPPAAALAAQVHHFSRLLLLENKPAPGGLRELAKREQSLRESIDVICGIASCVDEEACVLVSLQCVYASGRQEREEARRQAIIQLLRIHQEKVRWPPYDLAAELRGEWQL